MKVQRFALLLVVCAASLFCSAQKLTVAPGVTVTIPADQWTVIHDTSTTFMVEHHQAAKVVDAAMGIHTERRRDHAEAVRRLAEIEVEHAGETRYLLIVGWPAL